MIKTVAAQCVLAVSSFIVDNAVNLKFKDVRDSRNAFQMLRGKGFKCYHAGENAPGGPCVYMYKKENKELTIKSE